MALKLGKQHWVLEYYHICSVMNLGWLDLFYGKVKFVPYAFAWEKCKTMDFSETIVVYDLKLATDDRSDKKFLLISKVCPLGLYASCPSAVYMY